MDFGLLIAKLKGIAQTGLHYSKDEFDKERYEELLTLVTELLKSEAVLPDEMTIKRFLTADIGYATPKNDVRAVVFNDEGKLLMVQEKDNHCWSLPGGWADIGYSLKENVAKEVFEESGIIVKPLQIIAIKDKSKYDYPPALEYVYKFFIHCEILSTEKQGAGLETTAIAFLSLAEIESMNLSIERNRLADIQEMFQFLKNHQQQTFFD